jgi:hypothetical protein
VDLKPQKDEIKEFVTALVQERQAAEEAAVASDDDGSELEFDASASPAAKKKPASSEDTYKWNLSPAFMVFLGVRVSEMPFKEVGG